MQIDTNEYPSIHWKKFFDQFNDIETLKIEEWKLTHIIGYFCKRYQNYYNIKYSFKFNSTAPSKSFELFQIRKLSTNLSANPIILKDYIDWWFSNKIIAKKKRITSMSFLTDTNVVNEFKFKFILQDNKPIERSAIIPSVYLDLVKTFDNNIKTYGDLAFIIKSTDKKYTDMFSALKTIGFDISILDRVK